jgi:microcystin-dependent protein
MGTPYLGEIRLISFGFAPNGWALCNGQLLAIGQNEALFSLLGTTYGGDGQTTFALPNLQARVPIHFGQGAGLSARALGEVGGSASVTLTEANLPAHDHALMASSAPADASTATGNVLAAPADALYGTAGAQADFGPLYPTPAVAIEVPVDILFIGQPGHENRQPFLGMNYMICVFGGIFPSTSAPVG